MRFSSDSTLLDGSFGAYDFFGTWLPYEFAGNEAEFMATRTTASLGCFLNVSPIYDVWGSDAARVLTSTLVNRDFSKQPIGGSRHGIACNEKGQMLASGVVLRVSEDKWRTYWMTPAVPEAVEAAQQEGLDVQGKLLDDEYFFQVDGPKSLEIIEDATKTDCHDLKFGKHKVVKIAGTDMTVYRLGMSGALAYEVHGAAEDAEVAYAALRDSLKKFGGVQQGMRNYSIILHTNGSYPNQMVNFIYPLDSAKANTPLYMASNPPMPLTGSASDDPENFYATPYDVNWGYLVKFDHDFPGKAALQQIAASAHDKMVTLEWNPDDVGEVFTSQFRGTDVEPYEQLEYPTNFSAVTQCNYHMDYVFDGDRKVGISSGRTYSYDHRRMISMAHIDPELAVEGKELEVLWGTPGKPQMRIRARVAAWPYYQGPWRNETCDVMKMVPERPYLQ